MSQFCSKKVTQGKEYSGMLTHATDGSTKDEIRNPESGNGKRNTIFLCQPLQKTNLSTV